MFYNIVYQISLRKMSLVSKNFRSSYTCVQCIATRQYTSEGASQPTTSVTSPENTRPVNMSAVSQLRSITVNQLKLLNQFSKHVVKSAYEQGLSIAVNKEWIRMAQKFPSVLGSQVEKEKEDTGPPQESDGSKVKTAEVITPPVLNDSSATVTGTETTQNKIASSLYSIPQVLSNLSIYFPMAYKQNFETAQAATVIPQWKTKRMNFVSKEVVLTRSRHILASIATTDIPQSRLKRLEDFISHLAQYPQAKSLSVKIGAISALLRIRGQVHDYDTRCALQEALAMLGHVEPLRGRGIRILSMDGGGTRGILVIELLRKLEALTGRRVCEMFDFICGVSTGAIMAILFGPHKKNLQDCSTLYKEISSRIFNQSAFWGTGGLLVSHSYYDTALWEEILKTYIGELPLIKTARDRECPKVATVSAVVNQARVTPFVFRNYELPDGMPALYNGSSKPELWQAVRASAAAPSYFAEFRLGDFLHQDGGILVNNPTAIAIHEAKLLWPGEQLQCVVSFGTGRNHPVDLALQNGSASNGDSQSSWKTKFIKILDSATDTEAVHSTLHDLLPDNVYFRFNPYVNEVAPMSETRPEKLEQLERDAAMYARRNEDKFEQVAAALTQPRSYVQCAQDWIKSKSTLLKSN